MEKKIVACSEIGIECPLDCRHHGVHRWSPSCDLMCSSKNKFCRCTSLTLGDNSDEKSYI